MEGHVGKDLHVGFSPTCGEISDMWVFSYIEPQAHTCPHVASSPAQPGSKPTPSSYRGGGKGAAASYIYLQK